MSLGATGARRGGEAAERARNMPMRHRYYPIYLYRRIVGQPIQFRACDRAHISRCADTGGAARTTRMSLTLLVTLASINPHGRHLCPTGIPTKRFTW
jgi:hypothetical protein